MPLERIEAEPIQRERLQTCPNIALQNDDHSKSKYILRLLCSVGKSLQINCLEYFSQPDSSRFDTAICA
jgi:hypothetical protein